MPDAWVIELEGESPPVGRFIVLRHRAGEYLVTLDEAPELQEALARALTRAADSTPLPPAEPRPGPREGIVKFQPRKRMPPESRQKTSAIVEALGGPEAAMKILDKLGLLEDKK